MVRSVAAAVVCVLVAAIGHTAAAGSLAPSAVVVVFAGSCGVAWMLSARRVTTGQVVGLLVLCQVGVHLAAPHGDMSMGPSMLLGHALATVASAAALARGERFAWALAERLGLRAAPLLRPAVVPVRQRPALPVVGLHVRHDVTLTHSLWSRGPPVGSS